MAFAEFPRWKSKFATIIILVTNFRLHFLTSVVSSEFCEPVKKAQSSSHWIFHHQTRTRPYDTWKLIPFVLWMQDAEGGIHSIIANTYITFSNKRFRKFLQKLKSGS